MANRSALSALLLALPLAAGCAAPAADPEPRPEDGQAEAAIAPGLLRLAVGGAAPPGARLLHAQGARRLWRTPGGIAVQTEGPRIVATAGLSRMIMATRFEGGDPLARPDALLAQDAQALRLVDIATAERDPDGMLFGIEITCRLQAVAAEEAPGTLEIEERCRGPARIGSFTNRFTLRRGDGALLASTQWIGPGVPMLSTGPMP
jgi:hypothetical protein